jgi:hypothetical protein
MIMTIVGHGVGSMMWARRKSTAVRRYGSVDGLGCRFLFFVVVAAAAGWGCWGWPCSQQNHMASIIFASL